MMPGLRVPWATCSARRAIFPRRLSSAADLHAGYGVLGKDDFDVVLLDVSLSGRRRAGEHFPFESQGPAAAADHRRRRCGQRDRRRGSRAGGAQDYLVKSQLTPGWLERSIRYAVERHRMDMTLLAAEEKSHSVFDHLVEGIFQTTPEGRYLLANAALARIYGYSRRRS